MITRDGRIDNKLEMEIVNSKFYIRDSDVLSGLKMNKDISISIAAISLNINLDKGIHLYRALFTLKEFINIRGWIKLSITNPRNRLAFRELSQLGLLDYVSGNNLKKRLTAIRIGPGLRGVFPQYQGVKRFLVSDKTQLETPERKSRIDNYLRSLEGVRIQTPLQDVATLKVRYGSDQKYRNGRVYLYPISFMPKHERKGMTINGNPSIELDYISMHPTILYRFKGIEAPLDCYENSIDRGLGKSILLICLNAESFTQGYKAIIRTKAYSKLRYQILTNERVESPDLSKNEIKKRVIEKAKKVLIRCIDELKVLHKGIEEYLFSGISKRLMYIESEIALNVVDRYYRETRKAILSIHDSFIVEQDSMKRLGLIMKDEFDKVLDDRKFLNRVLVK